MIKTFETAEVGDKVCYISPDYEEMYVYDEIIDSYILGIVESIHGQDRFIRWIYNDCDIDDKIIDYQNNAVDREIVSNMYFYTEDKDLLIIKLKHIK